MTTYTNLDFNNLPQELAEIIDKSGYTLEEIKANLKEIIIDNNKATLVFTCDTCRGNGENCPDCKEWFDDGFDCDNGKETGHYECSGERREHFNIN